MLDLVTLAKEARGSWAVAEGTLADLKLASSRLKWQEVPVRSGEPAHAALTPHTQAEAKPNSLSAIYGLGPQPLHTDGAHLSRPPDMVALVAEKVNATPTRLWGLRSREREAIPWDALLNGVFRVHAGRHRFLATCSDGARIRYDPGCMSPCDQRARTLVRFFDDALIEAHYHHWDRPNSVLLIDNRTALHARAAVSESDSSSRTLHRIAFALGES